MTEESYRVLRWNQERDNLHLDLDLEARMLSEECKEFFLAPSLENMLKEHADFRFVWAGTQAKMYCLKAETYAELTSNYSEYFALKQWSADMMSEMFGDIRDTLWGSSKKPPSGSLQMFLDIVYRIVIESNETKGKTKVNGKIVKGDDYQDPEPRIAEALRMYRETL